MFGPYSVIARGSVLEVVPVAVLFKVVPFSRHLRGTYGEMILGLKVMLVIGRVNLPHIISEVSE